MGIRGARSGILALVLLAAAVPAGAQSDPNLAEKRAALEKLCASGVFTADECARRRAALSGAPQAAAPAGQVFRDPDGRYSAPVPDGWNASSDNGNARLTSGDNWVMLIPSPDSSPEQATSNIVHQIEAQYQSLTQAKGGRPKINGHDAAYATFKAVNKKGESVALMAAGIQAPGGHVLVFVSSAPLERIDAVSPQFLAILNGIRFAGE